MKAREMPFQANRQLLKEKRSKESDYTKNESNEKVRDILNRYLQTIANVSDVPLYIKKGSERRAQESENINSQKETLIRFLIHLTEIFRSMFQINE